MCCTSGRDGVADYRFDKPQFCNGLASANQLAFSLLAVAVGKGSLPTVERRKTLRLADRLKAIEQSLADAIEHARALRAELLKQEKMRQSSPSETASALSASSAPLTRADW